MAGGRGSATPPEQPEESVEMMAEKPTRTDADYSIYLEDEVRI